MVAGSNETVTLAGVSAAQTSHFVLGSGVSGGITYLAIVRMIRAAAN
jgi:hypothetical protein